jgi:hypothetical protein
MTPRKSHAQIAAADRRLGELEPWLDTLVAARQRWLLSEMPEANWTRPAIEAGVGFGAPCPNDPALEPLGRGWPGLRKTKEEISRLREIRSALEAQLPSSATTATHQRDAESRAAEITERAQRLDSQTAALRQAVAAIADLALDVAVEAREIWKANLALDKLCSDADIPRPATEQRKSPLITGSSPVGILLAGYFTGEQPEAVDSTLTQAIRAIGRTRADDVCASCVSADFEGNLPAFSERVHQ